jgi:hypothetical protein
MIGVNVPIPVPMAFYSFGGWKDALFGDHHIHGPEGIRFFTRGKAVTVRWPEEAQDPSHHAQHLHFPTARVPAGPGPTGLGESRLPARPHCTLLPADDATEPLADEHAPHARLPLLDHHGTRSPHRPITQAPLSERHARSQPADVRSAAEEDRAVRRWAAAARATRPLPTHDRAALVRSSYLHLSLARRCQPSIASCAVSDRLPTKNADEQVVGVGPKQRRHWWIAGDVVTSGGQDPGRRPSHWVGFVINTRSVSAYRHNAFCCIGGREAAESLRYPDQTPVDVAPDTCVKSTHQ